MAENSATVEIPQEDTPQSLVKYWAAEWEMADKHEKDWRKSTGEVRKIYTGEKKVPFNILHSNVQTIAPAVYSRVPRPDCRRRFADGDDIARNVADTIERSLSESMDDYDFDNETKRFIDDALIVGRGVPWVEYKSINETQKDPATGQPVLDPITQQPVEIQVEEQVSYVTVEWDKFRMSPAKCWSYVYWVGREHLMTREELVSAFGEIGQKVKLDWVPKDIEGKKKDDPESALKRATVREIWDKNKRRRIWIAPSMKEQPLRIDDDPLGLEGFFPTPRPLYAVPVTDSLVPIPEYKLYEKQADELNEISRRIIGLTKQVKARGIYDATLKKALSMLMDAGEGDMIPSDETTMAVQAGGLDKAIWMYPVETAAAVLSKLYEAREQTKQVIFEITGISDIVRGSTNASETATAQQIKSQFGSLRIQARQAEVQRIIRDILRMKAEIIAEKFSPQTLALLAGRPVSPEEMAVLKSDLMRKIKVDVETDSMIAPDVQQDQKNTNDFLTGVTSFLTGWGPIVQSGLVSVEVPKTLLMAAVRKFKMGREVEDALNSIGQVPAGAAAPVGAPPGPPLAGMPQGAPQAMPPQMAQQMPAGPPMPPHMPGFPIQ